MKISDKLVRIINSKGLSCKQAADMIGVSRQNLFDKLNSGNPRFRSVEKIANGMGYEIVLFRKAGRKAVNEDLFFEVMRQTNLPFDAVNAIVNVLGYSMGLLEKNTGTPHETKGENL